MLNTFYNHLGDFYKDKKILVTGAAGFIGSHISEALVAMGSKVIGLDNLSKGTPDNLKDFIDNDNFEFIEGDILDSALVMRIMSGVDIVFHEAAFISVTQSVNMPLLCNLINVEGTLNLLEAARHNGVKRFIFASSAAVYGDDPVLPKRENMPLVPSSPYGVSKLAAEAYVRMYSVITELETVALRYFNVYGPRQRMSPYSGVITIFLNRIAENKPLVIFGDGSQTRDFVFIGDIVNANLLAGKIEGISGRVFNIGTGSPISVKKLAETLIDLTGKKDHPIEYAPRRVGDVEHSYADISAARRYLNFTPKFDIEKGLEKYIEFFYKT